jgi:hypothetical protein
MIVLLALIAAALGWALWAKKITPKQLLPLILIIAGAGIAAKGQPLGGIAVLVIGMAWFAGVRRPATVSQNQSQQYAIDKARHLLGVSAKDDAETIRARHRKLILENHPDTGGNANRAAMLNEARDLLLATLENPKT